jgi:hypothetical protein
LHPDAAAIAFASAASVFDPPLLLLLRLFSWICFVLKSFMLHLASGCVCHWLSSAAAAIAIVPLYRLYGCQLLLLLRHCFRCICFASFAAFASAASAFVVASAALPLLH